jgi:transketolase
MRDTFIRTLTQLVASDPRIMLVTGDLGFGVLTDFARMFPNNFVNAGVAEQNMTGLATGLALEGNIVFTYSIANFSTLRCLEQIRNDAAYHSANVKVVAVGAGFSYGALGISHHATEDLAIVRSLPNVAVVSPSDVYEVEEATKAIVSRPGTAYLRLDKSVAPVQWPRNAPFELGKARTVRAGSDITFVGTGGILGEVLKAAEVLEGLGVCSRVLSMHTIEPLDIASLLEAAKETQGIITVEEHTVKGGLGGAVAEALAESGNFPGFFTRIGLREGFSSAVGTQEYLRKRYGLDAASIVDKTLSKLKSSAVNKRSYVETSV